VTFYLLSALPTLFFVIKIRSNAMRAIVLVVLFFVLGTSIISCYYCRRPLLMMVFFATAVELMYLAIFDNSSGKDKPLTKIYVLAVATLLLISLSEKLLAVVPGRHCAFRVFTFYAIIFVGLYGRIIFSLVNLLFGYSKV